MTTEAQNGGKFTFLIRACLQSFHSPGVARALAARAQQFAVQVTTVKSMRNHSFPGAHRVLQKP